MAVACSALRSESPARRSQVPSAGESSGALSLPYADPRSVPEDVRDRLLYQSGDPNKGPTKRAGCAECEVVFATDRAFDAHVRTSGHIDPVGAGLVWNPRGYYQFPAHVADTNVVDIQSRAPRAEHPSGVVEEIAECIAAPRTRMLGNVPPVSRVADDSTAVQHRSSTAARSTCARQ
jgi:hypothetical protein